MKNIAAIVVTYNRKDLLAEVLDALLHQTHPLTVLLIDNDSSDGTGEMVSSRFTCDEIKYFNTKANLGGAGGFHYGLKKAAELGFDYCWMMDDDAVPAPDALEAIVQAAKSLDGRYGFLCSNVRFTDGTAAKMNIPDVHEQWMDTYIDTEKGLVRIDRATFVGFFLSMETVRKVGLPIKEFFIWADDTNYSHRIEKTAPCYLVLNSLITHKMAKNETASLVRDDRPSLDRYFYAYRNRHYNARTEGWEGKYLLRILTTTLRILLGSDRKLDKLRIMYKGAIAGLFFNPKVDHLP